MGRAEPGPELPALKSMTRPSEAPLSFRQIDVRATEERSFAFRKLVDINVSVNLHDVGRPDLLADFLGSSRNESAMEIAPHVLLLEERIHAGKG